MTTGGISGSSSAPNPSASAREAKLRKAATELEAVFVSQILKEARPKGGLLNQSFATQTFQDMFAETLSKTMAERGTFGLADQLVRQLTPNLPAASTAEGGTQEQKGSNHEPEQRADRVLGASVYIPTTAEPRVGDSRLEADL